MNMFKKVAVTAVALVCSFAFATTAFAANDAQVKKAVDFAVSYGVPAADAQNIVASLNASGQLDQLIQKKGTVSAVASQAQSDVYSDAMNAGTILTNAANSLGISIDVKSVGVDRDNNKVVVDANVAGVETVVQPEIKSVGGGSSSDDNNNNSNSSSSTTTSAAAQNTAITNAVASSNVGTTVLTASSAAVIKATGDSSAAVVIAAVLAVAAVLGMAVRKNTQMNVA